MNNFVCQSEKINRFLLRFEKLEEFSEKLNFAAKIIIDLGFVVLRNFETGEF